MRSSLPRRRAVGLFVAAATAVALTTTVQPASAQPQRHRLPDSQPHWLSKAHAVRDVASAKQVHFGVLLKMRDQAGADAKIKALSDPDSASYGKWLSSAQFRSTYAPAAADVTAVQSWLKGQGFAVTKTLTSGMFVEASGTANQVEKSFGTSLKDYSYRGSTVQANDSVLSVASTTPAAVTGAIDGVVGLDQASALKKPADTLPGPPPGARFGVNVQPCSAYFGQKTANAQPVANGKHPPYAVCGYTPDQLQSAYGEDSLIKHGTDGHGITVAITDAFASPTILQDAQQYNKIQHQPLFKKGQFRQITPGPDGYANVDLCGGSGWYGEETLDVEAVHAMAPGAKVVYVGGSDCISGLDDAWASTIDNHVADVITNSWTDGVDDLADLGQPYIDFYQQFSTEAALTGITVNFSSGDSGDHTKGGTDLASKTAEFPADLPYVTGVGGTSLEVGKKGDWLGEFGWQTDYSQLVNGAWTPTPPGTYSSGGGGGASQLFAQPYYQRGVVPDSISHVAGSDGAMRVVPDISMTADPNTGMVVGETQAFPDGTYYDQYRIGGTSLSSPLLAGVVAVASQQAGHPLGFVNPLYYKQVGTNGLHDIVAPKSPVNQVRTNLVNGVDDTAGLAFVLQTIDIQTSTLHSTRGYDDETGVGSPNGPTFFNKLAGPGGGGGHGH
ncbi:MAG: serine protease [Marmoricola sp.]|jgi:subtilase family serine protease|nr:serine protease [Marmoricola sp.]